MPVTAVVNLSTSLIEYAETDPALKTRFLGGRGLGARLLFDRVGPDVGALDPDNCLIFTTAPYSATPWPTASRYHVTFKSPATRAPGEHKTGGGLAPPHTPPPL